jgi:hypothetical protein
MPDPTSLSASVSSSYLELTIAAETLNAVSDALGKAVSDIDEGLKKLNLGITAWVRVCYEGSDSPEDGTYRIEEIGYSKINGKWGVGLRTLSGDEYFGPNNDESIEAWLFNEAPRALRLKSIEKIPELLKTLSEEAKKVTGELQSKLGDAQAVAAAINPRKPNGFVLKGIKFSPAASGIAAVMRAAEPKTGVIDTLANVYLAPGESLVTSRSEVKK